MTTRPHKREGVTLYAYAEGLAHAEAGQWDLWARSDGGGPVEALRDLAAQLKAAAGDARAESAKAAADADRMAADAAVALAWAEELEVEP